MACMVGSNDLAGDDGSKNENVFARVHATVTQPGAIFMHGYDQ